MKRINLLHETRPEIRSGFASAKRQYGWVAAGWSAAAIWGGAVLLQMRSLDADIDRCEAAIPEMKLQRARLDKLRHDRDALEGQLAWLGAASSNMAAQETVAALSRELPEQIALTKLSLSPPSDPAAPAAKSTKGALVPPAPLMFDMRLEGVAADNLTLTEAIRVLSQEPRLSEVRLRESKAASGNGTAQQFVITAVVGPGVQTASVGDKQ